MRRIFLLFSFVLSLVLSAFSQPVDDDLPQVTGCIALLNAKVVSAPGRPPIISTIVMRDGLITQFGANLKIPPDAYRIAADSFYVYPAFIDAFSYTGLKESEENRGANQGQDNRGQRPAVDIEGNPPLDEAGITPYRGVRPSFDGKDKSVSDWRAQGFAIAHVVPKGKMIPGKGSIIVLSGKGTDQMLWKEDISMFGQWTGAGGAYPSTVIGIMAKWRELYHNASQFVSHQASYENGAFVPRPNYNQAHEALVPVVKKEMKVFFRAPKVKDISRAISMQKDLGMQMVIADAEEAWYLKDHLKANGIPLVLSIDLPEDKGEQAKGAEEAKEVKDTTELKSPLGDLGAKVDSLKVDPEKEAFEKRRAESLKMHLEQAASLTKAGIAFSFGTMSVKPGDFSKNMKTMIEHGLTADEALRALTTEPAKLLGVEKYCGTVDIGKMANLIVSTKPLFEKDAAIRYMMVEGTLYEYEVKEKKKSNGKEGGNGKAEPAALALLEGTWTYTIETPDQKREGKFEFSDGAGELKGTISSSDITTGNNELEDIVLDGNTASFTFDFDMGGQIVVLEFDLKLNGETFEGTVSVGEFGTFPVTGTRISKPD